MAGEAAPDRGHCCIFVDYVSVPIPVDRTDIRIIRLADDRLRRCGRGSPSQVESTCSWIRTSTTNWKRETCFAVRVFCGGNLQRAPYGVRSAFLLFRGYGRGLDSRGLG